VAVKIRLRRMGRKKRPFYRIVVADSRAPRDGRFIEKIGDYNPLPEVYELNIDEERALYWLKNGAIPTDTVKSLMRRKGITLKWHLIKKGASESEIEEEMKKFELIQKQKREREKLKIGDKKKKKEPIEEEEKSEEGKKEEKPEKQKEPEKEEKIEEKEKNTEKKEKGGEETNKEEESENR